MKTNQAFFYLGCLLAVLLSGCDTNSGKTKWEKIDFLMEAAFQDQEFIGNVLVADSGRIIYKKSFGQADAALKIQNSDSTKFLIASLSKPITAIIILRLVERGQLKLKDPLKTFFKSANSAIGNITIHQLLTHSSGIREFIGKERNADINSLLKKTTLTFKPGSDFEYSNSGYVLLIKIAELITGKGYEELVKTEVFQPTNMTSSGVARNDQPQKFAKGYTDATQKQTETVDYPFKNVDGAGSLYSTTEDLYKLDQALYSTILLSEKTKTLMLKQHIAEKYGYGWFISERGGIWDVYWHKGNLPGATGIISRRIKTHQLIVLLSNAGQTDIDDLERAISKLLKVKD